MQALSQSRNRIKTSKRKRIFKVVEKSAGLTLLAAQIEVPAVLSAIERDAHVAVVINKLRQRLQQRSADIVVLPELSTIDYSRASFSKLDVLAEPLNGQSVTAFQTLAREFAVMVVAGLPTRSDLGYHISQIIIDQTGELIGCYHKMHMAHYGASMEKDYFTPGSEIVVVDCNGFRLAPIICYDIRFPELTRSLALTHGVDMVLHCGAYYRDESFASWHAFVTTRAMENQHYVLSLNRAGKQYGHSVLAPPWVDAKHPLQVLHENDEELRYLSIQRQVIEQVRDEYTFLQDRHAGYSL